MFSLNVAKFAYIGGAGYFTGLQQPLRIVYVYPSLSPLYVGLAQVD